LIEKKREKGGGDDITGSKLRNLTNKQTQVGNEFSSVEALWSQFENVMAKEEEAKTANEGQQQETEKKNES
jgi:DASH complex subunit DAD1